jgi:hypothetical protein
MTELIEEEIEKSEDIEQLKNCLKVRYSTTVPDKHPAIYAYSLKVEIIKAIGYPSHLFVFQRSPSNNEGDSVDTFIQIASPLEVDEVPENAPDLQNNMPYYRADNVVLWFRNMEDLELGKTKIKNDLQTLVLTYKVLNGQADKEEIENYE